MKALLYLVLFLLASADTEAVNAQFLALNTKLLELSGSTPKPFTSAVRDLFWIVKCQWDGVPVQEVRTAFSKNGFEREGASEQDGIGRTFQIILHDSIGFSDIKNSWRLTAEIGSDIGGTVEVISVSVSTNGRLRAPLTGPIPLFSKAGSFDALANATDLRHRAGDNLFLGGVKVSYRDISNPHVPMIAFGFDVQFNLVRSPNSTASMCVIYRACSGLDKITNTSDGRSLGTLGPVLQEFPDDLAASYGEKVPGIGRGRLFRFISSASYE